MYHLTLHALVLMGDGVPTASVHSLKKTGLHSEKAEQALFYIMEAHLLD